MPVWMIAWSNIKRKKGVAISMGLLILLSTALFHVGLTLLTGIGSFYDRENERLHGAHYIVQFTGNEYEDSYLEFMKQDSRVEEAELQDIVIMDNAEFEEGGVLSAQFINMDDENVIKGYTVTEETGIGKEQKSSAVYLPSYLKEMGYQTGGTFTLYYRKQIYSFTVAGFVQSTWFASSVTSLANIYMHAEAYDRLSEEIGGSYVLKARLYDRGELKGLREDFKEKTDVQIEAISLDAKVMDFTIEDMKTGCIMVVTILSGVLFIFSFLMVLVAMIVMKFRITNHIESQMTNIGALEAMGYTGRQIKWSIAMEFLAIGVAGIIAGLLASYGIIAALGQLITSSVGVSWKNDGYILSAFLSGMVILTVVLLVSRNAAGRAARILPIQALRQGMENHSFKKNYVPLDKGKGPVSVLLALKQVMFHRKTYIMTGVIYAGVAFACAFSLIVFMNMGISEDLVLKLTGYEISDILVYKAPHGDYDGLVQQVRQVEGVRKTLLYEVESVNVEGELLTCYVSDDFDHLEMAEVYEGSFPQYDNEIVITGTLAKAWGKKIGDSVSLKSENGVRMNYVISGLCQTMNNFGRQCYLHMDGYLMVNPAYERQTIQVYLEPGYDIDQMIDVMEAQFKVSSPSAGAAEENQKETARRKAEEKIANLLSMYGADSVQYALLADGEIVLSGDTGGYVIDRIENNRRLFVSNVNSVSSSVSLMSFIIIGGTLCIIVLVFYMVIKSMLVRRRAEFGIYKAMGYTDRQLMKQIAFSFMPSSAGGTMAGITAACFSINRLTSMMFGALGISKLELAINPLLMAGLGVMLIIFSYILSISIAGKMKGITVYGLLTEV